MSGFLLFATVFLACAVEAVEMLTIVLAVGTVRGWDSTFSGVGAAVAVLAAVVAALGPALETLPIDGVRLVVGVLLLAFGLQWLRKAVLRSSGYRQLRDEDAAYRRGREAAITARLRRIGALEWYAFTVAFKGVLLEGLEVALIVVSFGTAHRAFPLAVSAALAALALVAAAGFVVRRPLSRVPENTIKFGVGLMLTSFGVFWGLEGAGYDWPGDELSLVGIVAVAAAAALGTVRALRAVRAVPGG